MYFNVQYMYVCVMCAQEIQIQSSYIRSTVTKKTKEGFIL